jgi:hypothetical protein
VLVAKYWGLLGSAGIRGLDSESEFLEMSPNLKGYWDKLEEDDSLTAGGTHSRVQSTRQSRDRQFDVGCSLQTVGDSLYVCLCLIHIFVCFYSDCIELRFKTPVRI